jgi:hypothetical protein
MLSRRDFFKWAGGAVAGAVAAKALSSQAADLLDPERALWVPGLKKIFVPELLKPDQFLTTDFYTREALNRLQKHFTFSRYMVNDAGLMVPVTPEGYRKGYHIFHLPARQAATPLYEDPVKFTGFDSKEGARRLDALMGMDSKRVYDYYRRG